MSAQYALSLTPAVLFPSGVDVHRPTSVQLRRSRYFRAVPVNDRKSYEPYARASEGRRPETRKRDAAPSTQNEPAESYRVGGSR